jgi:catechol 2,3-dioxygenase-like lactoylglutathione lyase family enzyme
VNKIWRIFMKRVGYFGTAGLIVILSLVLAAPASAIEAPQQSDRAGGGSQVLGLIGYMIVPDALEKSVEFYSHLLGLQMPNGDPRARLKWYDVVPFLTEMYGVKDRARNFTLRIPGADIGVEPMQWSASKGKLLQPRPQDPGASQLVLTVNDIDELLMWLTKGGVKVVTAGGKPVAFSNSEGKGRAVVVQDFHGYFVRLVQPDPLPQSGGANGATSPAYIMGANVAITVEDTERAARFYENALGVKVQRGDGFTADPNELAILGMKGPAQYRHSTVMFPGKSQLHLIEFKGVDRKPIHPQIVDPNAVVLRVAVRGMDALYTKIKEAQAQIVSVSGAPYLNGRTRWLMLRDPDNFYVQPVEQPQQAPAP